MFLNNINNLVRIPCNLKFLKGVGLGFAVLNLGIKAYELSYYKNEEPLDLERREKIKKIAQEMGYINEIKCLQSNMPSNIVFKYLFPWSKSVIILDKDRSEAEDFIIAHEMVHLKRKHMIQSVAIQSLAMGLIGCHPSWRAFVTLTSLSLVVQRTLSRMHEKEADLIACSYVSPEAIAAAIYEFNHDSTKLEINSILQSKLLFKLQRMEDFHPSPEERLVYLKDKFYKKSNLPPIKLQIVGNGFSKNETIKNSTSVQIREMIKKSNREFIFIDVKDIKIISESNIDNLVITTSNDSFALTIKREDITAYLTKRTESNEALLNLIGEGLKNPLALEIHFILDKKNHAEDLSQFEKITKVRLDNACPKEKYDIENSQLVREKNGSYTYKIPKI